MSTFSGQNYDAKAYLAHRPTYPDSLYSYLRSYMGLPDGEKTPRAVDVGCGSGQASIRLAETVAEEVVGVDQSEVMLSEAASKLHILGDPKHITFVKGDDSTLAELFEPHSVDLITVAEAAHWFEYAQFWQSCHKVLKRGGTLSLWAYHAFSFEGYPASAEIIKDFSLKKCLPYWDEGATKLHAMYKDFVLPPDLFTHEERTVSPLVDFKHKGPFELRRNDMLVGDAVELLRTYSAYHNYLAEHPHDVDILDETVRELLEKTGLSLESKVNVKWETVIICAKAK